MLTGVTNPHELMTAPAHLRLSYIVRDLRGLQETSHPPMRATATSGRAPTRPPGWKTAH